MCCFRWVRFSQSARPAAGARGWRAWLLMAAAACASAGHAQEAIQPPRAVVEMGMHTSMVRDVAADVGGRWAVTVALDKTARVWDLANGQLLRVLRPPQGALREGDLYAVALSSDGETVVVGGIIGLGRGSTSSLYLFNRATGAVLRHVDGIDGQVRSLGYSPDGRWLVTTTTRGTVQLFDVPAGYRAAGRSADCREQSHSAHFSPDSRSLLTTCWDGQLRRFTVGGDGTLAPPQRTMLGAGRLPYIARYAPDAQRIAVGYRDGSVVQVLDAQTLTEVFRLPLGDLRSNVPNTNLSRLAWSADGRTLAAGGRLSRDRRNLRLLFWAADNPSASPAEMNVAREQVVAVLPLSNGGWLWAATDPAWGVMEADGRPRFRVDPPTAALIGAGQLRSSADGRRVRFLLAREGGVARTFDLGRLRLEADDQSLNAARMRAPGLDLGAWSQNPSPTLNRQPLGLAAGDEATALAITADAQRFVLGTVWSLRLHDRTGRLVWARSVPDTVQAVNLAADERVIVAAHSDGTLRWYRLADGRELLAVLLHGDGRRWTAWLPEGFYAASNEDSEAWMGYHLDRGRERAGDFVSARRLRERYYQPELVSRRLDADGDERVAAAVRQLGHVDDALAPRATEPPRVQLLSPAHVATELDAQVRVRVDGSAPARLIYRVDGIELEGRPVDIGGAADGSVSRRFALSAGRREISVAALDERGVESTPVKVAVDVRPASVTAPALHLLAVGVTRYRDQALQRGVRFAAGDARAVRDLFAQQGGRLFARMSLRLLTDEQAGGESIRHALAEMARQMAPQDVAVVYLAGHGVSVDRQYHFIPWDAVYSSAVSLLERSLTHAEFSASLARMPATKTVVLLDTCSSGAFGHEAGRGLGEKDAIDRLSRLSGRATIAATADTEMALEGEGGHGAFTQVLLQGLRGEADRDRNGTVDVRELADYIETALPRLTARNWGFEQFPFSATEGHSFPLLPSR